MKKALTFIEVIFVIVIIGIISALIAPNFKDESLIKAANQVANHLRYTQHLALLDDKFDPNDKYYYKGNWQLHFGKSDYTNKKYAYTIYSDKPTYQGNPELKEMAKNPLNPKQYLSGGYSGILYTTNEKATKELNIGKKYGIEKVEFKNCGSSAQRISFDYLGRPIYGNLKTNEKLYSRLIRKTCHIWLCKDTSCNQKIIIAIEPETGYIHILPN